MEAVAAHLHQVGVPSIPTDVQVVIAEFLAGGFAKHMSWRATLSVNHAGAGLVNVASLLRELSRYFDARTNRPAMAADWNGVEKNDPKRMDDNTVQG